MESRQLIAFLLLAVTISLPILISIYFRRGRRRDKARANSKVDLLSKNDGAARAPTESSATSSAEQPRQL